MNSLFLVATASDYVPFLKPLPAWHDWAWPLLILPLCVAVSVVYKSIKCKSMSHVPREAAAITLWILLGMVAAAVVLYALVYVVSR